MEENITVMKYTKRTGDNITNIFYFPSSRKAIKFDGEHYLPVEGEQSIEIIEKTLEFKINSPSHDTIVSFSEPIEIKREDYLKLMLEAGITRELIKESNRMTTSINSRLTS